MNRCCDVWPHEVDEPCRYEGCANCGGTYRLAPSMSPLCWVCTEGEESADLTPLPSRPLPATYVYPDERPF